MSADRGAALIRIEDDERLAIPAPAGVSLARFVGFDDEGRFRVELPDINEPVRALSTVGLVSEDVGAQVAVAYEQGNAGRLIIIGRVRDRASAPASTTTTALKIDGERLVIRAERDLELRCGDASIVLTAAGKVLIKGNFVLTRSRGANKIKGAYVDIN
jgi:hypothetical protein